MMSFIGGGADVFAAVGGGSPWPDKQQPIPAESQNDCLDSMISGRSRGFSYYGASSHHVATSLRRKKVLRCKRCSFVTMEKVT